MARLRYFGQATPVLRYSNWIAAALTTLFAVYLHVLFLLNAGGLWRDEVDLVHLSLLPSFSEMWQNLPHDSCPVLMHLVVRAWSAVGFGNTDASLRVLGLYVGLFSLLPFWFASWTMRNGAPLLAVTLAGLNVTIIRAGDSLRGYGLGSALAVLTLAVIWRLARRPSLATFCGAAVLAVLSVQSLYQNAFLLFAACCGGFVLCAVERRWRDTLPVLAVGVAAAASLLPYVPLIAGARWYAMYKVGFDFSYGWMQLSAATGYPLRIFTSVWVALWIGALAAAISVLFWRRDRLPEHARGLILFAGTSLLLGTAGYALFLKLSEYPTHPWHYVPLMTFSAVCLDAVLFTVSRWARPAAIILAALAISTTFLFELSAVKCRMTNVNLVAANLSSEVAPNDYVIVHPFYCGVTFERYYKGTASWTTLPPLEDYTLQRWDLFQAKMETKDPIGPVVQRIVSTLQSGNRVWFVGNPSAEQSWFNAGVKVSQLLSAHSQHSAVVVDPSTNCVNPFENLPVFVATGWKP
ncbi:MAG: hypothetical protein DME88_15160 [Verrucomicrobia bacterium]|nr:MAG: hypothetical protein DME88_15160 [Verrucomicrobiota bacterium]